MLPLAGQSHAVLRTLLRVLPLSDYYKTRLWATTLPRPLDRMAAWPYYRCIDMATRAIAQPNPARGELVLDRTRSYSMLEFGVATGGAFQTLLHFRDVCMRKYALTSPIHVLGFDSFEGMPAARDGDDALIWKQGDLPSDATALQRALAPHFTNFRLVKGYFNETLAGEQEFLREHPPIFVSLDCDYYSSTIEVLDALLPNVCPNGTFFYFDDVGVNFYSDRTGQLKAIAEVNAGRFGPGVELIEHPLWVETRELRHWKLVYRLFNRDAADALQSTVLRDRPLKQMPTQRPRISPL